MIRLNPFDLLTPGSISEALRMIADPDGKTKVLAGGTDLIVNLKSGIDTARLERIVWLGKISEIQRITFSDRDGLRIGAMSTLTDVESHPAVTGLYPALADAVHSVASPSIRNRATLGGNLCLDTRCQYYNHSEPWRQALGGCLKAPLTDTGGGVCHATPGLAKCSAVFSSDTAPILIALGASIRLLRQERERRILLKDLYTGDGVRHLNLDDGELLIEVLVPPPDERVCAAFKKMRLRESIDYPLVNVGVLLFKNDAAVIEKASIIIGAVVSAPVEAHDAEKVLIGKKITADLIDAAANEAAAFVKPTPNISFGAGGAIGYRKTMAGILVKQALLAAAGIHGNE